MVVRTGIGYTILGIAAGLAGAFLLAGTLRSLVYDVSTSDPVTYATVALAILAVSVLASWIPALRASRADPSLAMRRD